MKNVSYLILALMMAAPGVAIAVGNGIGDKVGNSMPLPLRDHAQRPQKDDHRGRGMR